VLVGTPVTTAHRVLKVDIFIVPLTLNDVGETRLHATLRRSGVRALGRHQRKNDHVVTAAFCADANAETGKPAANDFSAPFGPIRFRR